MALPDNSTTGIQVACLEGTKIIGGGSSLEASSSNDVHQTVSRPFRAAPLTGDPPTDGQEFNRWRVVYRNPAGGTAATTARAFAICAETP